MIDSQSESKYLLDLEQTAVYYGSKMQEKEKYPKMLCLKRSESSLKQQIVPESQTSSTKETTKRKQTKENKSKEQNSPVKKSRKAALTSIKRNREILKVKDFKFKKTSEKNIDSVYNFSSSIPGSEKDYFCTPPRRKKFKRNRKVFQTDTETGSSEVSWFGKGKSITLFETPKKNYSNRKKNSKNSSYQSAKQSNFKKVSRQRRIHNTSTAEQARSAQLNGGLKRTVSSDIENYSLVIEKVSVNAKMQNHQGLSFSSNQILTAAGLKQESPISRTKFGSNLQVDLNIVPPSQPIKVLKFDENTPKSPTKNIVGKDLPMKLSRIKTALSSRNSTLSSKSIKSFTSITELKSKHQNSNLNLNNTVVEQSFSNDIKQSMHLNEPLSSISLSSKTQVSNVKKNTLCTENAESGGKELLFDSGINVTMCNGSQKGGSLSLTEDIAKGKNFLLNRFLQSCLLEQAEVFSENSSENRRATENSCVKRKVESSKSCYSNGKKLKCTLHCSGKLSLRKKDISNSNYDTECLQDDDVEVGKVSQMDSGMEVDCGTHEFHNTNGRLASTPIKKTGNLNTKHMEDVASDLSAIITESVVKSNKSKNKPYKNTDDFSSNQNFKEKLQDTIFSILTTEINYLVRKLLGTEQNSEYILHEKMLVLRKKLVTAGKISSPGHQEKTACDQFLNSFERIKFEVMDYLKSEEEYERKLRRKHEKAVEKYFCNVKMVIESAISSVEERILSILKHSFRKCVEIMHSI
ncbi:uncharacterized protein LOC118185255 [Stegodyphus dumicola]|uniref:uncharacterized protein LOC118185255 n=1 Tax=Stegodyphus dumicola TaxID=202533 RepID=UPI0015B089F5|nr:uncharacterized protein LOC118185255 [Stegodyphus dumicola]